MAETMSHVERVLWRIAELGARCSQHTAAGGREPLWAELEQTIANLEAEFESARQAVDIAPAQVRSLEGRLKVALKERDREKGRADEYRSDAEAARRERDRERQKARKAMGAAVQAKNAVAEASAAAAESLARATAAEAALDQAMAARNEAVAARDEAVAARDEAVAALDDAIANGVRAANARDAAVAARDVAVSARDEAVEELEAARARIAELEAALDAAVAGHEDAVDTLAARAEGAVVVLPGVSLPEPQVGPAAPANRVSWRPTWSEWANPQTEAADDVVVQSVVDIQDDVVLDESLEADESGVRYLNVAATIAGLLPDDLDPFLLDGASIVRREGRLFATIAVPTDRWAPPGTGGAKQAERFADAGFKVEWTTSAPLGV
ncbi:MAG TPA: hypothetical protein VEG38_18120 [Acidimicrobiia bacterium]|nr:hypothetical protein [Acidimicrobiia bacterium]